MRKEEEKVAIVADYVSGRYTYRSLRDKYGYSVGLIHKWVHQIQQSKPKMSRSKPKPKLSRPKPVKEERAAVLNPDVTADPEVMPSDVAALQEELRKARLHNELLTAMIDIAEDDLGLPIRKKYGAGRL